MIILDKKTLFYEGNYLNETSNNWTTLAMQLNPTLLISTQLQQPCIQASTVVKQQFFFLMMLSGNEKSHVVPLRSQYNLHA